MRWRACAPGASPTASCSRTMPCASSTGFPLPVMDASSSWRWTYISDEVLPVMRARGINEDDITTMLVDNPRAILEGGPSY